MLFKKWISFFIFSFSIFAEQQKICFEIDKLEGLDNIEPFVLGKLSYSSNTNLDSQEFKYLVGLQEGELVNSVALKNSCFYLKQKNKFKKICLNIFDSQDSIGKHLHFDLHANWTFNCLDLSGILVGKDAILQMYRLEHGDIFDLEKHKHSVEDIKKYFVKKGFFDVKIIEKFENNSINKSTRVGLKIKKGSRFNINSVNFNFFSIEDNVEEKFKSKIKEIYTKRFCSSYSTKHINKIKSQLKKYLFQHGFSLSLVEIKEHILHADKTVNLDVQIYLSKKIECFFSGNKSFSSRLLQEKLLALGHASLGLPIALLEEEISKFYKSKGFLHVTVESQRTKSGYCFYINEGCRINIKEICFCGENYLNKEKLYKFFNKVISKGYSINLIEDSILNLTNFYIKNNFLDVQAHVNLLPIDDVNYKLEVTIEEGEKSILKPVKQIKEDNFKEQDKFGKAIVFGSTNYSFPKILRELSFKVGETWDKEKLYSSFLKLRRLNAFETVRVYPHSEKDMLGCRPVYIKLYPANKYELKTRAGFQQVSKNLTFRGRSTYKLGASFDVNSPFLLGDKLSLQTDFTLFYRQVVASYTMPWINNFPYQTLFQAYSNKYQQPLYIGSTKNLYEIRQNGFLTSFENKNKFIGSALSMGIEKMRITHLSKDAAHAIKFSSRVVGKSIPYFFIEPNIFIDYLDNKINPSRGFFSLLSSKGMMSSCHNFDFFKIYGEHAFFIPILKPLVLATRLRLGHIFIKDFTQLFPSERFYLGGPNSLRGYFPDFAPPLGYFDCNGCVERAPIGGSSLWNLNFEVRFPVYKNFGLVFFNDLGGLANPFNEMNFLHAMGIGVRYFTSVGPLRLDFAWSPETSKKKSLIMWYFTFGNSF